MGETTETDVQRFTTCPMCGSNTPNLNRIESGLRLALQEQGAESPPNEVCTPCLKKLRKESSKGNQLISKQKAKDEHKAKMWSYRFAFIKQGRNCLSQRNYAEAAVAYEKYIKILEVVFDLDRKKLEPRLFQDRPKEITLIASVLWDLMLIYDAHPKFAPKQLATAEMLARFLRFTPINNSIIRRAEKEFKHANNPQAFRHFLKLCNVQAARCFIATAAFESGSDPHVQILCRFRDHVLKKHSLGRAFVIQYYQYSPQVARFLDDSPRAKKLIRPVLQGVAGLVDSTFDLPERRDS
ncbi:MAG: hypothetical protein KDD33_01625 [Bdellovibrionales bacterium]|nr:hypothetical protein [Bdellovibrionales bacterium]